MILQIGTRYCKIRRLCRMRLASMVRITYGAGHLVTATFVQKKIALAEGVGFLIPLVKMYYLGIGTTCLKRLFSISKLTEL